MLRRSRTPLALAASLVLALVVSPALALAGTGSPVAPARAASSSASVSSKVSDRLVVTFRRGEGARATSAAKAAGGRVVRTDEAAGFVVVASTGRLQRDSLAGKLRGESSVARVEVDRLVRASLTPNDPAYSQQWGLTKILCPSAWDVTTGGGVTIAVLDSGVTWNQPDLTARLAPGYNVISPGGSTTDDAGHGTAVAGVAAASINNMTDGAGVAPSARIMPVKVLDSTGTGYDSDVITGIRWAVDHGAKVINMSLGASGAPGATMSAQYQGAIDYARSKGAVVVAAAGNTGVRETEFYPAGYNGVIAVGATSSSDTRSSFSSYGSYVDVAAPGENIVTTDVHGGISSWSGTSFASPFVAGLAALVASTDSALTPAQIEQRIEGTARDLGAAGRDDYFGYGRVDAAAALLRKPPRIVSGRFTNPVAYELKSLVTTRFHTTVDTAGSWVELRIKTPKGDRVFRGATTTANGDYWFPLWDGKAPDGTRLPSAAYDWRLTASKGGLSSTLKGKITVSKIYFTMKGTAKAGSPVVTTGYMIPGSANVYASLRTATPTDAYTLKLAGPSGYATTVGTTSLYTTSTSRTWYVRSPSAVPSRAVYSFTSFGRKTVAFTISVIQ